jgi:hypothetical protein
MQYSKAGIPAASRRLGSLGCAGWPPSEVGQSPPWPPSRQRRQNERPPAYVRRNCVVNVHKLWALRTVSAPSRYEGGPCCPTPWLTENKGWKIISSGESGFKYGVKSSPSASQLRNCAGGPGVVCQDEMTCQWHGRGRITKFPSESESQSPADNAITLNEVTLYRLYAEFRG